MKIFTHVLKRVLTNIGYNPCRYQILPPPSHLIRKLNKMKIKLSIKNLFTGSVLFEYEKENNTLKETLLEAVKTRADLSGVNLYGADLSGADLSGADLSGADLSGADLSGVNLSGVNLSGANLYGAYLYGANLSGAYLSGADLSGAYLYGANLSGANLSGASLSGNKIKTAIVFTGLYDYVVIPYITEENIKRVKMGCYDRSLEEWESDFWNNDNEFPNNGSVKSNLRLMAFETAKAWFKIIEAS